MKLKNILISGLIMFALLFANTVSAESKAPSSFEVNGSDSYLINHSKYLPGGVFNIHYKKNTNGDVLYCTEVDKLFVTSGVRKYSLVKELDPRYAYVIANGYPNKSITGDKDKDYLITTIAVWHISEPNSTTISLFDFEKGTYRGQDNDVAREASKLVKAANSYSYANLAIKINSDNKFTLSSDKKYYVSSNMSVTTSGVVGDYTVSLENAPSGTIVTDTNGDAKSTFKTNEKFVVMVPVSSIKNLSSEFKVNVSATGTTYKAYLYSCESSRYQNTAVLYPDTKPLSASTTLKLDLNTKVEISKIDATTSKELPGAKLTVKDSDGNIIDSWVSTDNVHVIEGIKPGKYTLTEEIAPEGYVLSTETITFEVKADGTVTKVVMENELKDKVPVYISKQDATTGEELAGAHLELRDKDGNLVEAWVSEKEPHMILELKPGKYTLTEVLAPEGYELTTETVEFVVKEDGTVDGKVIMYNKPEVVEVPSTASFKTITASLIGIIVIGLGSMIIYRNCKKNEEY